MTTCRELVFLLKDILVAAQAERAQRQDLVRLEDGMPELGWVLYERQVMHDAVNALRAERGLGPVDAKAILGAENSACGHADYTLQYALRCADLVVASRESLDEPAGRHTLKL